MSVHLLEFVHHLNLNTNKLTTLPNSLFTMNLKFLDLSYNMLRYLPESIGMCKQLCVLKAVGNKIESIPESIGELFATLEIVELNDNAIRYLPKGQFCMLERLLTLNLDNN